MPGTVNLALFDFDHTITTIDTYGRFLRQTASPSQLAQARWQVGPWLAGYKLGMVSAGRLRQRVTRLAFQDRSEEEVRAQGARFARECIAGFIRPKMDERIAWHQGQGDEIVIVSGSLDVYLHPWCAERSLALICNALEAEDGRLTGRYRGGDCGVDKRKHIEARYDLARYPVIYAYGDSNEDRGMLALAHKRWFQSRWIG